MVKGASQALGLRAVAKDVGVTFAGPMQINTDASAAIGIGSSLGIGKVRHIEVNQVWMCSYSNEGIGHQVNLDT